MDCKEIEIPVPWGHVAVRLWGHETNEIVLVFHGILDNVGSFDRLIALLPDSYFYVCVDLPGHGLSSYWPSTVPIHTMNNLLVYKIIVNYFKREKYILMGHSYGGQLAFTFTQLYPEYVKKLIMLDTLYAFPYSPKALKDTLRNHHKKYFKDLVKLKEGKAPEYTYEEALNNLIEKRRYGKISIEAAEPLLKRMLIKQENGKYIYSIDQRIKNSLNYTFDFRYIADFIFKAPVLCPVLIVLGTESDAQRVYFKNIIKVYKTFKNIKIKLVEGNHDVHNTNPERVAPVVNKFLLFTKNKL